MLFDVEVFVLHYTVLLKWCSWRYQPGFLLSFSPPRFPTFLQLAYLYTLLLYQFNQLWSDHSCCLLISFENVTRWCCSDHLHYNLSCLQVMPFFPRLAYGVSGAAFASFYLPLAATAVQTVIQRMLQSTRRRWPLDSQCDLQRIWHLHVFCLVDLILCVRWGSVAPAMTNSNASSKWCSSAVWLTSVMPVGLCHIYSQFDDLMAAPQSTTNLIIFESFFNSLLPLPPR